MIVTLERNDAALIVLNPLVQYRDYLKNQFIAAARSQGYSSATDEAFADALQRRFHQAFDTADDADRSAVTLIIDVLKAALVAPVADGGFGLAAGQIPGQGQSSDSDYLAQLVGLSGQSTRELTNRYRVSFERRQGDVSSSVGLNIEALQGLMADSFQTPLEPVGVLSVPGESALQAIVPLNGIGTAPFFLEFDEWLAAQANFYPENLYDIRAAIPSLDATFRAVVAQYPDNPLVPGSGFFEAPGELKASKAWLQSLYPVYDLLNQALDKLQAESFGEAASLLDQVDGAIGAAINTYDPGWIRSRFEWTAGGVGPAGSEPLITLADRAALRVTTSDELTAFEAYFQAPFLPPFDGFIDPTTTAIREMHLARGRSLFIYDIIFLQRVGLPYVRAQLGLRRGAYGDALKRLAPLTGYAVGVAEATSTAPYASPLYQLETLPYTESVGFDQARSRYADHVVDIFVGEFIETFPLAPFERRHIKIQQAEVMLAWADRQHRAGGASARRARELFKGVLFLHLEDPDLAPHFTRTLPPPINFGGINPSLAGQFTRAKLGIEQIDHGLNAYGYADDYVPILRYTPLKASADRFAAAAKSNENELIDYIARLEQAELDEAQAQAMAIKADASLKIAQDREANAQFDVDRAQEQLAAVKAAIAAKQQEIADADSLFGQISTFLRKGVGDSIGDLLDSTDKFMPSADDVQPFRPATASDFSSILDAANDDGRIDASSAHEAAADALGGGFDVMESFVAFGITGYTALSSMADEANRRDAELASLEQHDLPLAQSVVALKQRDQAIAALETQVAQADLDYARWLLGFQRLRFESRAFWQTMAGLAERLMTRYVELGARTAWFAERALAFEQDRQLHIIRLDYQAPQLRNITGADLLLADLAELEATRIDGVRLTVPVTRTLSIARDFPTAFATLKATGSCRIRTTDAALRAAYPGTFGYRIRAVTPAVQTLRAVPLRGLLTNSGFSVISATDPAESAVLARFPDALPLSDFSLRSDSAIFGVPDDALLSFEGSGLETDWTLTFPPAANPQGLSALADVMLTFNLNATWRADAVTAAATPPRSGLSLLLSGSTFDPGATRTLRAGAGAGKSVTLDFNVTRARLDQAVPLAIANLGVLVVGRGASASAVTIATAATSATTAVDQAIAMSNAGRLAGTLPASPLNALVGESANQHVRVTLTPAVGGALGLIRDVVLYLDLQPSPIAPVRDGEWAIQLADASVFQPQFDRAGHSAVYDASSNRMIVVGGSKFEEFALLNDVEALTDANGTADDSKWLTLLEPRLDGAPSPRGNHSAVYDAASNRMILFGGATGIHTFVNDVWVLSNANGVTGKPAWIQLTPGGTAPAPRGGHSAAYDAASNRMIVFGGGDSATVFSDVWILTEANGLGGEPEWIPLAVPGIAPALTNHAAAYHQATNSLIAVGGLTSLTDFTVTNAAWRLAGANGLGATPAWTPLIGATDGDAAPQPRSGHSAVLDAAENRMLVFGGGDSTGIGFFADVWALSGIDGSSAAAWTRLCPGGQPPAPRVNHTAVFDPATRRMIVYAGGSTEGSFFSVWILRDL